MPLGVLFALCAYALYSCCDAIIKGFGTSLSVHEIAFFSALFSLIPAVFSKPKGERWRDMLRLRHPWLVHLRGISGLLGNICIIYAFVSIPLAEAYSLAFLAPVFIVAMSAVTLGERVSAHRMLLLGASFCGVLLVVRPGFRELELGHFLAIAAAACGAVTTTVLRRVSPHETRVSLLGVALGYIVIVNGIWMIPDFRPLSWEELAMLLVIGAVGGTGNILFIAATRRAPVTEIAPVQYSQIFWAIGLGAVFFHEFPDGLTYAGLAVVVAAGIFNAISGGTRIRIFSRLSLSGFGPATTAAEISPPLAPEEPAAADSAAPAPAAPPGALPVPQQKP